MKLTTKILTSVIATGVVLAAQLYEPEANAGMDDSICAMLTARPSEHSVEAIGIALMGKGGLSPKEAAGVVITAVQDQCPQYMPLLYQAAAVGRGGNVA